MEKIKLAVVGIGSMGTHHMKAATNDIENATLVAICDIDAEKVKKASDEYKVPGYTDVDELFAKEKIDAIVIATPHYDHTTISVKAFEKNIHVLTEKPLAVHAGDAQKMTDAYDKAKVKNPDLQFAVMFQQRSNAMNVTIKKMIADNVLGKLIRATWIITTWFRTQAYYNNGGWRATWEGEGGGVLLNQCPHQLDLYQWFFGVPETIIAHAAFGKYHDIEVEDEVSAIFKHKEGMIGQFITTTTESVGTNRLEIMGENGKLIADEGKLTFTKTSMSMLKGIYDKDFKSKDVTTSDVPFESTDGAGHTYVTKRFCNAIQGKGDNVANGSEGINSLYLSNGIILSAHTKAPVQIPFEHNVYADLLQKFISESKNTKKKDAAGKTQDLKETF